jgi:hypothetical protein
MTLSAMWRVSSIIWALASSLPGAHDAEQRARLPGIGGLHQRPG